MTNLVSGTGIATVFVDHQLRDRALHPNRHRDHQPDPDDVGRPVTHLVSNLAGYDALSADVRAVLDTLTAKDVEVRAKPAKWYTVRIIPTAPSTTSSRAP